MGGAVVILFYMQGGGHAVILPGSATADPAGVGGTIFAASGFGAVLAVNPTFGDASVAPAGLGSATAGRSGLGSARVRPAQSG